VTNNTITIKMQAKRKIWEDLGSWFILSH